MGLGRACQDCGMSSSALTTPTNSPDAPSPAAASLESASLEATPAGSQEGGRTSGEVFAYTIAALVVGCFGVYYMRSLLAPAFFALTLVVTVRPFATWAVRKGAPRWLAATGAVAIIYAFVIGLFAALAGAVVQLVDTLPRYTNQFQNMWVQAEGLLERFGIGEDRIFTQLQNVLSPGNIVSVAQGVLGQVTSFGSLLMILALAVVFLMFDMAHIEKRAASLLRLKPALSQALDDFVNSVRSYWLVSTIFGLIVAVLDVVALMILGVPMAITWGVVSFITNYIPNIGFVLGVIPPALLGLVDGGPWTALWVVVAYSVLNFVIQSLIQPKFTGDAVGLNTTTTFLSLMFWSSVIGGLGTILAVPLTLFAKAIFIDSDPRSRWLNVFLMAGDKELEDEPVITEAQLQAMDLDGDGVPDAVVAAGAAGAKA